MNYKSSSQQQTKQIAADILQKFLKKERAGALIFALNGELGAGKTQFVQGAAEFLGIERNITSPTFIIMKNYLLDTDIARNLKINQLYHFDLYRLHDPQELKDLDWQEIISNKNNLVFVEWAERAKDLMPPDAVWVKLKATGENSREIDIK